MKILSFEEVSIEEGIRCVQSGFKELQGCKKGNFHRRSFWTLNRLQIQKQIEMSSKAFKETMAQSEIVRYCPYISQSL